MKKEINVDLIERLMNSILEKYQEYKASKNNAVVYLESLNKKEVYMCAVGLGQKPINHLCSLAIHAAKNTRITLEQSSDQKFITSNTTLVKEVDTGSIFVAIFSSSSYGNYIYSLAGIETVDAEVCLLVLRILLEKETEDRSILAILIREQIFLKRKKQEGLLLFEHFLEIYEITLE